MRILVFLLVFLIVFAGMIFASEEEIKSSPNYLVLLVHGIGAKGNIFGHGDVDNHSWEDKKSGNNEPYGDLKYFLDNDLGLKGYVYAYSFADSLASNITHAHELGDKDYYKNNPNAPHYKDIRAKEEIATQEGMCMLDFAKKEFKEWFVSDANKKNPEHRPPTEAEIPKKFVIISHSLGGLPVRYYLTSDFYQNDIAKAIFLDVPHTGADGMVWYNNAVHDYGLLNAAKNQALDYVMKLFVDHITKSFGSPPIESLYVTASNIALTTGGNIIEDASKTLWDGIKEIKSGINEKYLDTIQKNAGEVLGGVMYAPKKPSLTAEYIKQSGGSLGFMVKLFNEWRGPGLDEVHPQSSFIESLKTAKPHPNSKTSIIDPIEYSLVTARGTPTPHKDYIDDYYILNPYSIGQMLPYLSEYNSLPSESAKLYSALVNLAVPGGWAIKDGSVLVAVDSSRGEGVEIFKSNTKRYEHVTVPQGLESDLRKFKTASDTIIVAYWALQFVPGFQFNPTALAGLLYSTAFWLSREELTALTSDEFNKMIANHGYILRNVYDRNYTNPSIIEKALDDTPDFGGNTITTTQTKRGISAASVKTMTASYDDYEQSFSLLSNLDGEKNELDTYHEITMESFTAGYPGKIDSWLMEIDGKKKYISGVTVKEPPTVFKGVINAYLPKKLKLFQYSENFSAWKNIEEVDQWGNFVIRDLRFAEGQNTLAFRAESWTGNKKSQQILITVNSIPLVISEAIPTSEVQTNNNLQKISGKFGKAAYSSAQIENIELVSAKLMKKGFKVSRDQGFEEGTQEGTTQDGKDNIEEIDITDKLKTTIYGDTYDKHLKFEYLTDQSYSDGQYTFVITVKSNIGTSQGVIPFVIDTKPPVITMEKIAPYSPERVQAVKGSRDQGNTVLIKYSSSDDLSPLLKTVRCDLYMKRVQGAEGSRDQGNTVLIKYSSSDDLSPLLKTVRCDLYMKRVQGAEGSRDQGETEFICNIATAESLSKGENFFSWDGSKNGAQTSDGKYNIKIKAFDLAGNFSITEEALTIDSMPPTISNISMSPTKVSSKTEELKLTAAANENASVVIQLKNLSTNKVTAYLTNTGSEGSRDQGVEENTSNPGNLDTLKPLSYSWKLNDALSTPLEDGIYNVELIAKDEAGNSSNPVTFEGLRIDRTPPTITNVSAMPYVMMNNGTNKYKTTLSYRIISNDQTKAKVKLYNSNTGALVYTWDDAPAPQPPKGGEGKSPLGDLGASSITWNANSSEFPKGAYRFQVIAEDDFGNIGSAYASCVKDGIAPTISYPSEDYQEVSGTIVIRGTATDPDWTNGKEFKQYSVYCAKGSSGQGVEVSSGIQEMSAIEVPLVNRDGRGTTDDGRNVSVRPVQNNSTLAYLNTNLLENGEYTIKVIVEESGYNGEVISTTRIINVQNQGTSGKGQENNPYIKLKEIPSSVDFKSDGSVTLPIGFVNSVKTANVYVEILKPTGSEGSRDQGVEGNSSNPGNLDTLTPVYFKYFPNILGAPYIGEPSYKEGRDLGYFIWQGDDGTFHLRASSDGKAHRFSGNIIAMSGTLKVNSVQFTVDSKDNMISWDTTSQGGFDFTADGQIMITANISENSKSPSGDLGAPSPYADKIFLGISKYTQAYLPIIIDPATSQLVDLTDMSKAGLDKGGSRTAPTTNQSAASLSWDGCLDTGGYADNGTYIVRVIAEGADGIGLSTDEAVVNITTPYDFKINAVSPSDKKFSTLGAPDRVSIFYNVSKDSIVNANVYRQDGTFVSNIAQGKEVLGKTIPLPPGEGGSSTSSQNSSKLGEGLYWRGNYPDSQSGQIVTGGNYKIVLTASAKDGSSSKTEIIDGISIDTFSINDSLAKLNPIGEETFFNNQKIRYAEGESPYYFEAKGIGKYFPQQDFDYTLTATGEQIITAYPYVPFTGLMHRWFDEVNCKAIVRAEGQCTDHWTDYNIFGAEHHDAKSYEKEIRAYAVNLSKDKTSITVSGEGYVNDWYGGTSGSRSTYRTFDTCTLYLNMKDKNGSFTLEALEVTIPKIETSYNLNVPANIGQPLNKTLEEYVREKLANEITLNSTPTMPAVTGGRGIFDISIEKTGKPTLRWELVYTTTQKNQYTLQDEPVSYLYKVYITRPNTLNKYDLNFAFNLKLKSEIEFSRLTNRFIPYVGFVRYGAPYMEDFSDAMEDIATGLAFPGRLFFEDTDAYLGKPYKSKEMMISDINSSVDNSGGGSKTWGSVKKEISESNLFKYDGSKNATLGYEDYLSYDHIQFIPITEPDGGKIEYQNNSPIVKAYTNLVYPAQGKEGVISDFKINWPLDYVELDNLKKQQSDKKKELDPKTGNPQKYTSASKDGTYWDFNQEELNERGKYTNNTKVGIGRLVYSNSSNRLEWSFPKTSGQLIDLNNLSFTVIDPYYSVSTNTPGVNVSLSSTSPNGKISAYKNISGDDWTTADDINLVSSYGVIKTPLLKFNEDKFLGKRELEISDFYQTADDYQSAAASKYTFLKYDPFNNNGETPVDNPNIKIEEWNVKIKDKNGETNKDIALKDISKKDKRVNDAITLKLKLDSAEKRYVQISGKVNGSYELSYFDGETWKRIYEGNNLETSNPGNLDTLAWWDVSRLNGKYTVLLKSGGYIAQENISIGTLVPKGTAKTVYSAYKRAELDFPQNAFVDENKNPIDQLVTVTPVSMNEIYVRNRPIIMTQGPIVEIFPSPWKFEVNKETGVDMRPTLKFIYTQDDLFELGLWDRSKGNLEVGKDYGFPLNIHQITKSGDLQIVSENKQDVELNNGEYQYVFSAPLDHFSTYTLLKGKFSLSAPIVFADRYMTNKDTVIIYGTAEPNSILNVYVYKEPVNTPLLLGEGESPTSSQTTSNLGEGLATAGEDGKFKFENIPLSTEGDNYIYVTSHPKGDENVVTYSDVVVTKDTIPPSLEGSKTLSTFSPNNDGKFDEINFKLKSNEKGTIYFKLEKVR